MNKSIKVNGYNVRLQPYTEKRRSELIEINEQISEYASTNPDWDDIPISVKANFWQRKAQILWSSDMPSSLFESEYFEQEMLMETESFFLNRQVSHLKKLNIILAQLITTLEKPCQVARNAYGLTVLVLTNIKATCLLDSIQLLPCRYGINLPISLQRPW